jgi:nitrogenase iron protein NifH
VQRIAVYGKGGIGKSVTATCLSACFARDGMKVLHVGCDPKRDSAVRLMEGGVKVRTVLEVLGDDPTAVSAGDIINVGRMGIHCCEAGGPKPGLGCGGRGVARTIEFLDEMEVIGSGTYDAVVFDVLGDVVCGGFAAPLRQGFAEKILVVLSEEPMALYAANNICRAVQVYGQNGVVLAGLVANLRSAAVDRAKLERFAAALSTRILAFIPRDETIQAAERRRMTVVEYAPGSESARCFAGLAETVRAIDPAAVPGPTPMEDEAFYAFMEAWGEEAAG